MIESITSLSNPIIKQARAMRQKKWRDESGLFLVEGILHVGEAAEAGWKFDTVLFSPERLKSSYGRQLIDDLLRKGERCIPVSEAAFESFSEKENPSGIAALIIQKHHYLSDISSFEFLIAVVSPQDPGNVGTILRTIDAVNADGLILLDGGVEPFHPSVVRASMGTIFWRPIYTSTFLEFLGWAKPKGIRIIGTSSHAKLDFHDVRLDSRPTILLLGSEQKGLLPDQLAECNELISIKMSGRATSLNLAVAAGVLMYALKG